MINVVKIYFYTSNKKYLNACKYSCKKYGTYDLKTELSIMDGIEINSKEMAKRILIGLSTAFGLLLIAPDKITGLKYIVEKVIELKEKYDMDTTNEKKILKILEECD